MKRQSQRLIQQESKKKKVQDNAIIISLEQHQNEWGLDANSIEDAWQRIKDDGAIIDAQEGELLLFLYAKGLLAEESSAVRREEFRELLGGKTKKIEQALERLKIIISGETSPKNSPIGSGSGPSPFSYFEDFVARHPEWDFEEDDNSIDEDKESNFVVFRDHSLLKGKDHALVERFQKSGLCYMHAPVVLQHYLVAMANKKPIPMLDMTKYLKQNMPGTNLYSHIWENKGGDSFDFLEKILFEKLPAKNIIDFSPSRLDKAKLCKQLVRHGPALVSGFRVSENFKDKDQWCHTGKQPDDFSGMHAMLLVGYRKFKEHGTEKTHYLLQNWWKSKAYVEVDIDFLISSKATVRFITKKQKKMGDFPVNDNVLVECDVDACEQFIPEG